MSNDGYPRIQPHSRAAGEMRKVYFFSIGAFNTFRKKYPVSEEITAHAESKIINADVDIEQSFTLGKQSFLTMRCE